MTALNFGFGLKVKVEGHSGSNMSRTALCGGVNMIPGVLLDTVSPKFEHSVTRVKHQILGSVGQSSRSQWGHLCCPLHFLVTRKYVTQNEA